MKSRRLSFEEWLQNQGVVEKRENTQEVGGIFHEPGINYSFKDKEAAANFCSIYSISPHVSRKDPKDLGIFKDPLSDKWTIYISEETHAKLVEKYKKHLTEEANIHRPSKDILEQIKAIQQRKTLLANKPDFSARLTTLNELATNYKQGGWNSQEATSGFDLSFRNYIALNQDLFNEQELADLHAAANLVMGPNNVYIGVKQDANWWDYVRKEKGFQEKDVIDSVITDTLHLLGGKFNRRGIDIKTLPGLPMLVGNDEEDNIPRRDIKRFLPYENNIELNKQTTDAIYLDSGGMSTHRTITKIWKRGVDAKGNPVEANPHHYEFYQTEYNAGEGSNWKVNREFNSATNKYTTGVAWVVATKRIKPNWKFENFLREGNSLKGEMVPEPNPANDNELKQYNEVMSDTIAQLIISQRLITLYKPKDANTAVTVDDEKKFEEWQSKINSHLGDEVIEELSFAGAPQQSGNCTVMSVKVMIDDEIHSLSEEHWRHAKQYNGKSIVTALDNKVVELGKEFTTSKKLEENANKIFIFIKEGNVEEVRSILKTYPEISPNILLTKDRGKFNQPTMYGIPLAVALHHFILAPQAESKRKEIVLLLINQGGEQINTPREANNITPLHMVILHAQSNAANSDEMIPIAAKLIEKGASLDIKNALNKTVLADTLELPIEKLGALLFKLVNGSNPNQLDAICTIINTKPELVNISSNNGNSLLFLTLLKIEDFANSVDNERNRKIMEELLKVAHLLIEKNPNTLDVPNESGLTPLNWLTQIKDNKIKNAVNSILDKPIISQKLNEAAKEKNGIKSTKDIMSGLGDTPPAAGQTATLQSLLTALTELNKTLIELNGMLSKMQTTMNALTAVKKQIVTVSEPEPIKLKL